jgi:two-component system response regulator DevR
MELKSQILKIITFESSTIIAERMQSILCEVEYLIYLGNVTTIDNALNAIDQQKPDVIILDIYLDEISSDENRMNLIITLREKYPKLQIIIFTNLAELHYRITCIANGANYFFDKSHDFKRLYNALNKIRCNKI